MNEKWVVEGMNEQLRINFKCDQTQDHSTWVYANNDLNEAFGL